ncbi:hypothetical protein [Psychrosphaera algicola]|uniref:Polymer-forming cytoskeletal protein n=1 Tax=Psychrosphaera algicola TaxID=3023714 RepID=A0ABT5FGR7_9GAMM|nr:hypothetical protein [Psychrosphaera sp. G1-22]MDC2890402.1 hypothetical protein [Psychrosphaera sp. G1-22]
MKTTLNHKLKLIKIMGMYLTISTLFMTLTGCVIGNRIAQDGSDSHTSAGNIDVRDNNIAGDLSAYNGNISIGQNADVKAVEIVNGNIAIGDFSRALSLETTNGNIITGKQVLVTGDVKTVNGEIRIATKSVIGGNIITVTGDVVLADEAKVDGDIIIEKTGFILSKFETRVPIIEIGKDVIIKGKIHVYRPIELRLDPSIDPKIIVRHD